MKQEISTEEWLSIKPSQRKEWCLLFGGEFNNKLRDDWWPKDGAWPTIGQMIEFLGDEGWVYYQEWKEINNPPSQAG